MRWAKTLRRRAKGFIDFLLLNEKGFPFIVLEAKAEDKNPLVGKEQARKIRQVPELPFRHSLRTATLHYFWDLERGNPYIITRLPDRRHPSRAIKKFLFLPAFPTRRRLIEETIADDYVVLTQRPATHRKPLGRTSLMRARFIEGNSLRFLRPYQKKAIVAIQQAVKRGSDRFLLEMATGTGKTLTSAAIITSSSSAPETPAASSSSWTVSNLKTRP